jgi:hypothetical protein
VRGFGRLVGHGVGLASSFLGCHHCHGVSVLADRDAVAVRDSGRIVSGLAVLVGGSNIGGGKHLTRGRICGKLRG